MKENITKPALFWKLLQVVIKKKKKIKPGGGGCLMRTYKENQD